MAAARADIPPPDWDHPAAPFGSERLDREAMDRETFGRCFRASFGGGSTLAESLARLERVAWYAYCEGRPPPFRQPRQAPGAATDHSA